MIDHFRPYLPAALLTAGCLLLLSANRQQEVPLRAPLNTLPVVVHGLGGTEQTISPEEQAVAGMSTYLLRSFGGDTGTQFSVYIGYYASQTQGRTIHSPKNCLPGAGWEPTEAHEELLAIGDDRYPVNRYSLVNGRQKAVVVYWYQGRGRIAANEYRVKLDLLRDAAIRGRTEEALIRIVVPVTAATSAEEALDVARSVAGEIIPSVTDLLPGA